MQPTEPSESRRGSQDSDLESPVLETVHFVVGIGSPCIAPS